MDAINTTSNATGAAGAATVSLADFLILTLGIFVVSWVILWAVMYVLAPRFSKFADQRSRIVYSAVYTLPFAIIFAIGLGGTMNIISPDFSIVSVVLMIIIVFGLVILQSMLLGMLISRGIIKMQSKKAPPAPVKGKRKK